MGQVLRVVCVCVCSLTLARTCALASMHLSSSFSSGCSRAVSLFSSLSAPPIVCLSVGYFPSLFLSLSRSLLLSLLLLLALSLLLVFLRPLFFSPSLLAYHHMHPRTPFNLLFLSLSLEADLAKCMYVYFCRQHRKNGLGVAWRLWHMYSSCIQDSRRKVRICT